MSENAISSPPPPALFSLDLKSTAFPSCISEIFILKQIPEHAVISSVHAQTLFPALFQCWWTLSGLWKPPGLYSATWHRPCSDTSLDTAWFLCSSTLLLEIRADYKGGSKISDLGHLSRFTTTFSIDLPNSSLWVLIGPQYLGKF